MRHSNLLILASVSTLSTLLLFSNFSKADDISKCFPVVTYELIKVPRCAQKKVKMNKCIGSCYSEDKPHLSAAKGGRNEGCMCCKPTVFEDLPVEMTCSTIKGFTIDIKKVKNPAQCSCTLCG